MKRIFYILYKQISFVMLHIDENFENIRFVVEMEPKTILADLSDYPELIGGFIGYEINIKNLQ